MTPAIETTAEPWPADRLREARSILADVAHHPGTRVVLAARVVIAHSPDCAEQADAFALQRILETGSSAATVSSGDAA